MTICLMFFPSGDALHIHKHGIDGSMISWLIDGNGWRGEARFAFVKGNSHLCCHKWDLMGLLLQRIAWL